MAKETLDHATGVRLSEADYKKLSRFANELKMSKSAVIQRLVNQAELVQRSETRQFVDVSVARGQSNVSTLPQ